MTNNDFHKERRVCIHVCFCRFKLLGILDDSEPIDGVLRKLFFLFFIMLSVYGVGMEVFCC